MKRMQTCVPEALEKRLEQERENFSMSSFICNILAKHIEAIDEYRSKCQQNMI